MIVYHNIYQNEEEMWCVSYTENNEQKVSCFENNQDAVNFYMS